MKKAKPFRQSFSHQFQKDVFLIQLSNHYEMLLAKSQPWRAKKV